MVILLMLLIWFHHMDTILVVLLVFFETSFKSKVTSKECWFYAYKCFPVTFDTL